jgi:hypothetical protein
VTDCDPRKKKPNVNNYQLCNAHGGGVGRCEFFRMNCRRTLYGRFVIVQIVGRKEYLTLCEVDVYGMFTY